MKATGIVRRVAYSVIIFESWMKKRQRDQQRYGSADSLRGYDPAGVS